MADGFSFPNGRVSDALITKEEVVDMASDTLNVLMFLSTFTALFSPCLFG